MKKHILFGFKHMGTGSITLNAPTLSERWKKNINDDDITVRKLKNGKLLLTKKYEGIRQTPDMR